MRKHQTCVRITITARGNTEGAIEDAITQAVESVLEGNKSGADSNDDGGYYFTATDEVPKKERPA